MKKTFIAFTVLFTVLFFAVGVHTFISFIIMKNVNLGVFGWAMSIMYYLAVICLSLVAAEQTYEYESE